MKKRILFIVLFAAILCFIWGNSVLPPDISKKLSDTVASWLSFGGNGGGDGISGFGVRKIGHFFEFAALGFAGLMWLRTYKLSLSHEINIAIIGAFFFSVCDETIQLFNGRGSTVADVWIDIGGVVFGCLVIYGYLFFKNKRNQKTENNNNSVKS